jgi:hypothetical protein
MAVGIVAARTVSLIVYEEFLAPGNALELATNDNLSCERKDDVSGHDAPCRSLHR